jgi:hypothetical protein
MKGHDSDQDKTTVLRPQPFNAVKQITTTWSVGVLELWSGVLVIEYSKLRFVCYLKFAIWDFY